MREGELERVLPGLSRAGNLDGLLVTMPQKFAAAASCATRSDRARRLGVVSVMRRNPDGYWHGDMLDGIAFVKAQTDAGARPDGARVLLLGAGGAGSAIAVAARAAGCATAGGDQMVEAVQEIMLDFFLERRSEL